MTGRLVLAALALNVALGGARGHRVPEPVSVPKGAPHISWTIGVGGTDEPERTSVCQSDPRAACTLTRSAKERTLVTVHFYLHPAATETRYTGSARIGFFDQAHEITINSTVKPGDRPVNHSVKTSCQIHLGHTPSILR